MKDATASDTTFEDLLIAIDEEMAANGVSVPQRPFQVLLRLILEEYIQISTDGGVTHFVFDGSTDFVVSPWFRQLYKMVEAWYRDQFGAAFDRTPERRLSGVVLIRCTPFALRVPVSRHRPAESEKQVWLSFPDHIEDDDVVTSWLVSPPNIEKLSVEDRDVLESDIREVAGNLRFIRSNLMGVKSNKALAGLIHGVTTHLEQAATLILRGGDNLQKAWWELQMAIESSLKGLILLRTGKHPFTHNLECLLDDAKAVGMAFECARFDAWPNQKEMSRLRYSQGIRSDLVGVFDAYRLALALAVAAADAMVHFRIGKGRFLIQQPPWLRDNDTKTE